MGVTYMTSISYTFMYYNAFTIDDFLSIQKALHGQGDTSQKWEDTRVLQMKRSSSLFNFDIFSQSNRKKH